MTESDHSNPQVLGRPDSLVEQIQAADGLLVGFDFDGTLAPIADDPDVPTISPRLARLLRRLADRDDVRVAVVSGRELDDLANRVDVEDAVYAGNHGLELSRDGEYTVRPDADEKQSTLQSVATTLERDVADVPGTRIENKGLTLTLHVRQTPSDRVPDARRVVEESVGEHPDIEFTTGKEVFEIRPAVPHDKGTTMELLARETPDDWLTLYLGDDTTDEDAFEAIQPEGLGIHVGTADDTAASYRIPAQQEVPAFVEWLATTADADAI